VLDTTLTKRHSKASAGYFFSPQITGWVLANAHKGQGFGSTGIGNDRTTELFYQHDRLAEHNFVIAGIGSSYRINDHYSISVTGGRRVRGATCTT
jgi:hypothetical protein